MENLAILMGLNSDQARVFPTVIDSGARLMGMDRESFIVATIARPKLQAYLLTVINDTLKAM